MEGRELKERLCFVRDHNALLLKSERETVEDMLSAMNFIPGKQSIPLFVFCHPLSGW